MKPTNPQEAPANAETPTRLVLIEGMPGSGKTTTAQWASRRLAQCGRNVAVYLEGDWRHPADYEAVACLDEPAYRRLLSQFPEHVPLLEGEARVRGSERFFSYGRMQQDYGAAIPEALIAALARYEVYEQPVATYRRLILQRWQDFTQTARREDVTYVFECCFLQNPLTMLLGRNQESIATAGAFIQEIAASIQALSPLLIYLQPDDLAANLRHVAGERPQAWLDFVIDYHTGQGTGKAKGWTGLEGLIQFYRYRQAIELELLSELPFPHLLVQHRTWDADRASIARFLHTWSPCEPS